MREELLSGANQAEGTGVDRRQWLWGVVAAWFGLRRPRRAAARECEPQPPACPHSYDGRLWTCWQPGRSGYYLRAPACPFCGDGEADLPVRVTTYCYDAGALLSATASEGAEVVTYVYDPVRRAGEAIA